MDLASARGTKLSDIVVDHRPSTGRGKKLTLAQEGVLKRLYEQELPSVPNAEAPVKGFWVNLAERFREQTGREYSWLSVKRRAAGWRQNSPEVDRRLDGSFASDVRAEDSVAGPSYQHIGRESPRSQGSCDSEQAPLPQKSPSPQLQDSKTQELSPLERSPSVGNWLQRNLFSGVTVPSQGNNSNIESSRVSQRRPRSRSPERVSQPRYRRRSSSTTRRTKMISKRLHRQLASSSDAIFASGPNPLSDSSAHEDMQLPQLNKRNPPGLNRVHESVEKDEPDDPAHDSAGSKLGDSKVSNSLMASPHLSEQDDLPLAPARIMRRRFEQT
ncbi:hypothetical protein N7491_001594 [Penicillium cf. griseofulvum]|uniref:Uncharacterized protein n=1 Tax=Penicillium cf. griseofulvum TaxID=2972120 RepID=A0A9W9M9X5_9EURO|nr:hypothetical protein N7472_006724 [Penicillium cf. griseofulvum]KAJ5445512.1 hypothetical protein N7491_001594 [Penicillium cf. griseofulvum]KAJ5447232.1 hypothetical protein N7445_002053 [Penicillium cf. griseofulvum]